jgi:hypothetical protein
VLGSQKYITLFGPTAQLADPRELNVRHSNIDAFNICSQVSTLGVETGGIGGTTKERGQAPP